MRKLPYKQNGEQGHGRPFDHSAGCRPAQQRGHGARKRSNKGSQGGVALERRVDGNVDEPRQQRQHDGYRVGEPRQHHGARSEAGQAQDHAGGRAESACGQRPLRSPHHFGVGLALNDLVQNAGSAGDQRNPQQGLNQTPVNACNARSHGSQVEAGPGQNSPDRSLADR